jgi:cellulose synthase/poly-beta-1,6-N-acetylglucosamine synthase-like glycosyltransferase
VLVIEILFWWFTFLIAFTYFVYPAIVFIIAKTTRRPDIPIGAADLPSVTVVVSVFNEALVLRKKLENLTSIDYPSHKIAYLFGSDGSTDETAEILKNSPLAVAVKEFTNRRGKASVLNDLACEAKGDIIVFSDANTIFRPDTVQKLVQHFVDPTVGAVSGELKIDDHPDTVSGIGESSYWDYENLLKQKESEVYSILGATGGVYAVRRHLYKALPTSKAVTDDFLIPLNILKQGYRTKYEREARAYEKGMDSIEAEFRRKVRIGAQNFTTISEFASLLHPRAGFVSFALWSHKIIRWCVPFLLIGVLASCLTLAFSSSFYKGCLWGILAFIGIALMGFVFDKLKIEAGPFTFPYYFLAMNAALLVGFVKFALGTQGPTWDVARRS